MGKKIFLLVVTLLAIWISYRFFVALGMGAVFAVLFYPAVTFLEGKKFKKAYAAAIVTLGITFVVLFPATILLLLGVKAGYQQFALFHDDLQAITEAKSIEAWFMQSELHVWVEKISSFFSIKTNSLVSMGIDFGKRAGVFIANFFGHVLATLPTLSVNLVILIVSIYFFLVDGQRLVQMLRRNDLLNKVQTEDLLLTTAALCRSVVLASVLSGFVQSLIFGLVCLCAGVPNASVIAMVVFVASFIPLIGSAPVTLGLAGYYWIIEGTGLGLTLIVTALVVSTIDNVVRPAVLKGKANLHPLIAFISAFGGLQVMGFAGLFLGPIIAGVFCTMFPMLLSDDAI